MKQYQIIYGTLKGKSSDLKSKNFDEVIYDETFNEYPDLQKFCSRFHLTTKTQVYQNPCVRTIVSSLHDDKSFKSDILTAKGYRWYVKNFDGGYDSYYVKMVVTGVAEKSDLFGIQFMDKCIVEYIDDIDYCDEHNIPYYVNETTYKDKF